MNNATLHNNNDRHVKTTTKVLKVESVEQKESNSPAQ